jgi:hypothetical protein
VGNIVQGSLSLVPGESSLSKARRGCLEFSPGCRFESDGTLGICCGGTHDTQARNEVGSLRLRQSKN